MLCNNVNVNIIFYIAMMIFIYYVMERQRRQLKSFDQCRYICYVCCSDILISLYDFVCKYTIVLSEQTR